MNIIEIKLSKYMYNSVKMENRANYFLHPIYFPEYIISLSLLFHLKYSFVCQQNYCQLEL